MILFHEALLADSEDPELYAAAPIVEWEHSEQGQWVKQHALEVPSFRIVTCTNTWGHKVQIYGKLKEQDEIIFRLKYGYINSNK